MTRRMRRQLKELRVLLEDWRRPPPGWAGPPAPEEELSWDGDRTIHYGRWLRESVYAPLGLQP